MIQPWITYCLLLSLKAVTYTFFRVRSAWIGEPLPDPWSRLRLVAILNHTSLYEVLFAAVPPNSFLRDVAWHGVVPVAEKTANRPLVGRFFRLIARHVVSITRQRDHTWASVLQRIEGDAMVMLLPEGRMKRANGLDAYGKPMTVRGGVADVIEAIPEGRMLLAYSGGLHHVQHPGEWFPRLFKTIRMNLEVLDIAEYRRQILDAAGGDPTRFRELVRSDLERRRDQNCPPEEKVKPRRGAEIAKIAKRAAEHKDKQA